MRKEILWVATAIGLAGASTWAFADDRDAIAGAAAAALASWAQTWQETETWAVIYRHPDDERECIPSPAVWPNWSVTYVPPKNPKCNTEEDLLGDAFVRFEKGIDDFDAAVERVWSWAEYLKDLMWKR